MNELAMVKVWHSIPSSFPLDVEARESLALECCGKTFGEVWALARFAPTRVGFTSEQPNCTRGQE
jgi:hypothetical protein